jgi:hypothetical protein
MKHRPISSFVLLASGLIALATGACVPDFPETVLADPAVLQHAAVVAALEQVGKNLTALYGNTTRDGMSFAVVSILRDIELVYLHGCTGACFDARQCVHIQQWYSQDE